MTLHVATMEAKDANLPSKAAVREQRGVGSLLKAMHSALNAVYSASPALFYFAVALAATLYVALALTPSHYAIGLRTLGIDANPLLGTARAIRSDEWIVLTPLFQSAVLGKFATINTISPYQESLKGFYALPIQDWSLLFKPQLWSFWVLPPAYAYSVYFTIMWTSFIVGYAVLAHKLGATFWMAVFGALCLFNAHFVQVWWTSNAPALALAPWPLIVLLSSLRPTLKAPLLAWTTAIWVFSEVYPPLILPSVFALGVLGLSFRRDVVSLKNVFVVIVAATVVACVFVAYYGDTIALMQSTVYPGSRISAGGGVELIKLLAHLFPFVTTRSDFTPLLSNSNECEVSVVATFLPLAILCFSDWRTLPRLSKDRLIGLVVLASGLIALLAWMFLPVPPAIGRWLLWTYVPPQRMVWGFGLLLTIALIVISSRWHFQITPFRFAVFAILSIGLSLGSKFAMINALMLQNSWMEVFAVLPLGLATVLFLGLRLHRRAGGPLLFGAVALAGAITFGTFNPLQPAHPIFGKLESQFLDGIRGAAKENPNGWVAIPGMYGALLSGAGIRAINHTLMAPELAFFRTIFPDIPEEKLNAVFNRYAHIIPQEGGQLASPSPDVVVVPLAPFRKAVALIPKQDE